MPINRFFDKIEMIPFHSCWEWSAGKDKDGYGKFWSKNKTIKAHRFSYEIHNGVIEKGLLVCHKCDNPGCVNPAHLFVGTSKDNNTDTVLKGRWSGSLGRHQLSRTHCPHGHEYSKENSVIQNNSRKCRSCRKLRSQLNYRLRKRAQ